MNETNISWLHDGTMATISTNDPRIIGQLETLADKDPNAAKMLHRYHGIDGGEDWVVRKGYINISDMEGNV